MAMMLRQNILVAVIVIIRTVLKKKKTLRIKVRMITIENILAIKLMVAMAITWIWFLQMRMVA